MELTKVSTHSGVKLGAVFLPVSFSGHAIGVPLQRDGAIPQMRDERCDANVIVDDLSFSEPGLRIKILLRLVHGTCWPLNRGGLAPIPASPPVNDRCMAVINDRHVNWAGEWKARPTCLLN